LIVVDALDLAYVAFIHCRISGRPGRTLDAARYALERASQAGALEVEIPTEMLPPSEARWAHQLRADRPSRTRTGLQDLSAEQLRLFALTRLAAAELKELCSTAQPPTLTRCIGYALHNLPEAARSGSWYSNDFLQFGFRRAAFFWASLPVGIRHLLCQLADIDVESAEYLIKKRGFVIPARGSSGGLMPWSEMQVVEDWTDPDAN
jgi:hypothetical protein